MLDIRTLSRALAATTAASLLVIAPGVAHADETHAVSAPSSTAQRTDPVSAKVRITSPAGGALVYGPEVVVRGVGVPGDLLVISMEGPLHDPVGVHPDKKAAVGPDGTWTSTWPLTLPGSYSVTATSGDETSSDNVHFRFR